MFSTITIEGWVLTAGIGLPAVCLFITALGFLFKRKKDTSAKLGVPDQVLKRAERPFGQEIDRQVLVQELDRRLAQICSFIQQERSRLLMLAGPDFCLNSAADETGGHCPEPKEASAGQEEISGSYLKPGQDINSLVTELAAKGMPSGQIARSLDLSLTEVDLILKVNGLDTPAKVSGTRTISAVA